MTVRLMEFQKNLRSQKEVGSGSQNCFSERKAYFCCVGNIARPLWDIVTRLVEEGAFWWGGVVGNTAEMLSVIQVAGKTAGIEIRVRVFC